MKRAVLPQCIHPCNGAGLGERQCSCQRSQLDVSRGQVSYSDLDQFGDDTSLVLAGRYYFAEQFAAGLPPTIRDDVTVWGVNARWELPARN